MKRILFCLLVMFLPSIIFATFQKPDIIYITNIKYELLTNPLELYYINSSIKRPDFKLCKMISSANLRGYIATWIIRNKQLYLKNIDSCISNKKVSLKILFPNNNFSKKISATWFSGKLRIPLEKRIIGDMGKYESLYEKELIITVKFGKIIKNKITDNTELKFLIDYGMKYYNNNNYRYAWTVWNRALNYYPNNEKLKKLMKKVDDKLK